MITLFWCPRTRASRASRPMGKVHDVLVGPSVHFMKVFGVLTDSVALSGYAERCLARDAELDA